MLYVGRILQLSKGVYKNDTTYDVLDMVQVGSAIYQSKKPNNIGHAVTDTEWWDLHYDLGEAIAAVTNVNSPETHNASLISRIMCIGTDGLPHSITPKELIDYVIKELLDYDIIARDKPTT